MKTEETNKTDAKTGASSSSSTAPAAKGSDAKPTDADQTAPAIAPAAAVAATTTSAAPANDSTKPSAPAKKTDSSGRKYITGPRGSCYYLTESGKKGYVSDKSLCGGSN